METNAPAAARAQLIAQFKDVPETTRALIFLVIQGLCPYCFANIKRDVSMATLIKRGLIGDKLTAAMDAIEAEDAKNGIDPNTNHATDCPAMAQIKAEAARLGLDK